jgi:hypothetical protein
VVFTTIHKFMPEKGEAMPDLSARQNSEGEELTKKESGRRGMPRDRLSEGDEREDAEADGTDLPVFLTNSLLAPGQRRCGPPGIRVGAWGGW